MEQHRRKQRRSDRQKELVAKLYAVHENLRKQYGTRHKDWDQIWNEHKGNLTELRDYSTAMYELATEIWDPRYSSKVDENHKNVSSSCFNSRVHCRIEWVYLKSVEFFSEQINGGNLLKLLDVGSCYNPFEKYKSIFDITAIDLFPAPGFEHCVYQCDFLEVPIDPSSVSSDSSKQNCVHIVESKLISLPVNFFDIVVFSFLLEYLPDQKQRLECCRKAAELLRPGGILFIIRPDSNNMTVANVRLIKQWKVGLSLLGLKRVYYEKLIHMWCTGYVKLDKLERENFATTKRFQHDLNKMRFSELHELFAISQDHKSVENENVSGTLYEKDVELFGELPFAE